MKRMFSNFVVLALMSFVCVSIAAIGIPVSADVVDDVIEAEETAVATEAAEASEVFESTEAVTEVADTAEKKAPLPHEFPEPLLTYLAKEKGKAEPLNPEEITFLSVNVNHCEYGEPVQTFSDEKTIGQFREALQGVTLTGKEDDIFSTETSICYSAVDQDGNRVLFFSIQNGLLEASDGRYALEGLGPLMEIDGA